MDITVTFIGNATTLIAGGGMRLVIDPNFLHQGEHAYLGYGLLSKRLREPAMDIDELPPLEAPAPRRYQVAGGTSAAVRADGNRIIELERGASVSI